MADPLFDIQLYNKNRVWQAPVGAFKSVEGTKRFDNISDFEFTVAATHKRLPLLTTPGTRCKLSLRGDTFIEGPIRSHDSFGPGVSGEFTFGVEDNFRILRNFLIYQVPTSPVTDQSTAYRYQMTGNAEAVFKDIVTKNLVPRSYEPIIVATNLNRGATVTASARMAKVYNEMFPLLEASGLGVKVVASPAGLTVDVYVPGTYGVTLNENSRIVRKWKHHLEAPEVTGVIVGGEDERQARKFIYWEDTVRETLWGDHIEFFLDARDVSTTADMIERAEEVLFDGAGTASIECTLAETKNFKFGGADGLNVGQIVTAKVANNAITVTDILREIDFSWNVEDGLKLKGTIGKKVDPTSQVTKAISTLAGSMSKLKASQ